MLLERLRLRRRTEMPAVGRGYPNDPEMRERLLGVMTGILNRWNADTSDVKILLTKNATLKLTSDDDSIVQPSAELATVGDE